MEKFIIVNEVGNNMASVVKQFCRACSKISVVPSLSSRLTRCKKDQSFANGLCFSSQLAKASDRRLFQTSAAALKSTVGIIFIDREGDETLVQAKIGETLLDVAKDNDIDLEGACEGTLACSTCHLVFDPKEYEKLDLDPPTEEELDMLDLAYGLTDTSRLGCQIEVTEKMDGMKLTIPVCVDARS